MSRHHRNLAGGLERVEIPYRDAAALSAARDIQPPRGGIRIHVIETANASDLHGLQNFVWTCIRRLGQRDRSDGGENHDKNQKALSHGSVSFGFPRYGLTETFT